MANQIDQFVVGIDLGTTNSCIATFNEHHQRVEVIPNKNGKEITPSVICFTKRGRLVGSDAKSGTNGVIVYDTKRLIGRKYSEEIRKEGELLTYPIKKNEENGGILIEVNNNNSITYYSPEEIANMILRKLCEFAYDKYMKKPTKVVVAVPAHFNDEQRKATVCACKIAGLEVLNLVNEPTAAALAYGFDKKFKDPKTILVFDLGGGTFDVTLIRSHETNQTVLATDGDSHLGGKDFDENLMKLVIEKWKEIDEETANKMIKEKKYKLKLLCEEVKITLTANQNCSIDLTEFYEDEEKEAPIIDIKRKEFEVVNEDIFKKCFECIDRMFNDKQLIKKGISKESVEEVILVGGSTKIPKIREMVGKHFDLVPNRQIDPDQTVAIGAALLAFQLQKEKENEDQIKFNQPEEKDIVEKSTIPTYIEITSHSIKLKTKFGFSLLIPRFTKLPAKYSQEFKTSKPFETSATFPIYEGEGDNGEDLHLIDAFSVVGIPPLPQGAVKFVVECEMDLSGTLNVSARTIEPPNLGLENMIVVSAMTETKIEENLTIWKEKSDVLDLKDEEYITKASLLAEEKKLEKELEKVGLKKEKESLRLWFKKSEDATIKEMREVLDKYKNILI